MITPGTSYKESGKVNLRIFIFAYLTGALLSSALGYIYAFVININPVVYLNFLLLAGAVLGLIGLSVFTQSVAHSRNTWVNIAIAISFNLLAWYVHWATLFSEVTSLEWFGSVSHPAKVISFVFNYSETHSISIGRLGRGGVPFSGALLDMVYVIEFIAFQVPVYTIAIYKNYYCETCGEYYDDKLAYIADADTVRYVVLAAGKGDYSMLDKVHFFKDLTELKARVSQGAEVLECQYYYCAKCGQNSIVNISCTLLHHEGYNKKELTKKDEYLSGVYIDDRTNKALLEKFNTL